MIGDGTEKIVSGHTILVPDCVGKQRMHRELAAGQDDKMGSAPLMYVLSA